MMMECTSTRMHPRVYLSDTNFTSRFHYDDAFVLPRRLQRSADNNTDDASPSVEEEGVLISPWMMSDQPHHTLQQIVLGWRCSLCGALEADATFHDREAAVRGDASPRDAKQFRKERRRFLARASSSTCSSCFMCPRCVAGGPHNRHLSTTAGLQLRYTSQRMYYAECSYCHWSTRHFFASMDDLMAHLQAFQLHRAEVQRPLRQDRFDAMEHLRTRFLQQDSSVRPKFTLPSQIVAREPSTSQQAWNMYVHVLRDQRSAAIAAAQGGGDAAKERDSHESSHAALVLEKLRADAADASVDGKCAAPSAATTTTTRNELLQRKTRGKAGVLAEALSQRVRASTSSSSPLISHFDPSSSMEDVKGLTDEERLVAAAQSTQHGLCVEDVVPRLNVGGIDGAVEHLLPSSDALTTSMPHEHHPLVNGMMNYHVRPAAKMPVTAWMIRCSNNNNNKNSVVLVDVSPEDSELRQLVEDLDEQRQNGPSSSIPELMCAPHASAVERLPLVQVMPASKSCLWRLRLVNIGADAMMIHHLHIARSVGGVFHLHCAAHPSLISLDGDDGGVELRSRVSVEERASAKMMAPAPLAHTSQCAACDEIFVEVSYDEDGGCASRFCGLIASISTRGAVSPRTFAEVISTSEEEQRWSTLRVNVGVAIVCGNAS